jgi:neutral ceramidase
VTRRFFERTGAAFSSGLAAAASPRPPQASEPLLKTGFAERDTTPDIGMEQPGGYGKVYLRTFHDACKVRAAVFDDGSTAAALVGIDSLVIPRPAVLAARARIRTKCGIPGDAVMVGASHSHSSGPVGMVLPGEYDHAPADLRKLAYEHSSMANAAYLKRVEDAIVEAVAAAHAQRAASRCSFGSGREDKVAFNRRFRMKSGQSWSHPGQNNPDIVEPAGPIDPIVGVIGAWDDDGRLKGCVVHYTCHATTSPGGISANWIYYMERMIQGILGPQVAVVFLQGFCGDVTQVDNRSPYRQPTGTEYAELVGGRVGAD